MQEAAFHQRCEILQSLCAGSVWQRWERSLKQRWHFQATSWSCQLLKAYVLEDFVASQADEKALCYDTLTSTVMSKSIFTSSFLFGLHVMIQVHQHFLNRQCNAVSEGQATRLITQACGKRGSHRWSAETGKGCLLSADPCPFFVSDHFFLIS